MRSSRGTQKFRFLWITDPWDTLDHPNDTTLRLMQESVALGFKNYWSDVKTIALIKGRVQLKARKLIQVAPSRTANSFHFEPPQCFSPSYFNSIQYRTDPPVDQAYLHPLQLLTLGSQGSTKTQIVNPPAVLFSLNEKFLGSHLPSLFPPSIVSSQISTLLPFGKSEKQTVLKPLHEAQSKGVALLSFESKNEEQKSIKALRQATQNEMQPILLQRFLSSIYKGESRLWFLDGRLLAFAEKRPSPGQFRINMDQGGTLAKKNLTNAEQKSIPPLSSLLKRLGIRLAAIDLIEGKITDFNFTSPGLLPQIEELLQVNLAKPIIQTLAR